jgi:hypothetical protein
MLSARAIGYTCWFVIGGIFCAIMILPGVVFAGSGSGGHSFSGFPGNIPSAPVDPGTVYQSLFEVVSGGFATKDEVQIVARDRYCRVSDTNPDKSYFVPSKHDAGWQSFLDNTPSDVRVTNCQVSESCIADSLVSPWYITETEHPYTTSEYVYAEPSICYLDTDRKINCTGTTTGVVANFASVPNGTPDLRPLPGFEDVAYLEYEIIQGVNITPATPFGGGCGIRADDLTISCSDSIYPSYILDEPAGEQMKRIVENHPHGQFTEIELTGAGACALGVDKKVSCWGGMVNPVPGTFCLDGCNYDYLGDMPEPSADTQYDAIKSDGRNMVCGIRSTDQGFDCWGSKAVNDNPTIYYPSPNQNFQDVFFLHSGNYDTNIVSICGFTQAGEIVCPSDSDFANMGFETASIDMINTLESNGPYKHIYELQSPKSQFWTIVSPSIYVTRTDNSVFRFQRDNFGQSLSITDVPTLDWDNPEDYFSYNYDEGGHIHCGFVNQDLQCIQVYVTDQSSGAVGDIIDIPDMHQYYNDSYCSTL